MSHRWPNGIIRGTAADAAARGQVVKLGGSLLTGPTWPEDLAAVVAGARVRAAGAAAPVIVVGGGPVVDGLRAIDAAASRPQALMHDLAIEAMRLTARLVADALRLPIVATVDPVEQGPVILDAGAWLVTSGSGRRLPPGWETTSDSIAAAVAAATGRQLLLVKRVPPPCPGDDLAALADAGWVDAGFPTAAASIRRIAWACPV